MYINPFLAGILATIGSEILCVVVWSVWYVAKHEKDDNNETK